MNAHAKGLRYLNRNTQILIACHQYGIGNGAIASEFNDVGDD